MTDKHKLKRCPFCGSENIKYYNGWKFGDRGADLTGFRTPSICCVDCEIGFNSGSFGRGVSDKVAEEQLKEDWNRRINDR